MHYDVLLFDFRGFGKSEGEIENEQQFLDDTRSFYNTAKLRYDEKHIVVVGYSIGTGPAAMLASENKPKSLILLAPYYNLTDMMKKNYSMVPGFILKYKFATNEYLSKTKVPVTIFHGRQDQTIYFGSSLKLQKHFKPGDRLFPLENQKHGGMDNNLVYQQELRKILDQ
jgi:pimeloyl-ACP methyl ester carboxylesterase